MKLSIGRVEAMQCDDTIEEVDQLGKAQVMSVIMKPNLTRYSHLQGRQGHRGSPSMEKEETDRDRGSQSEQGVVGISLVED
jgi:hypothetical protein